MLINFLKKLTILRGKPDFSQTREVSTQPIRERPVPEIASEISEERLQRPIIDSLACPYCFSTNFQRRGFRKKKFERVQLYLCQECGKTFTGQTTKGKHYPLSVMLDAISIYNLGYSLEQTCRIINERQQKIRSSMADFLAKQHTDVVVPDPSTTNLPQHQEFVKRVNQGNTSEVARRDSSDGEGIGERERQGDMLSKALTISAATLSNWLSETEELCRFSRMRPYALKKYSPKDTVIYATLAHRQLYRYRFHQAKCQLIISDDFKHHRFGPLQEFLEMVPAECPHQYFQRPDAEIETGISGSGPNGTSDQKTRTNSDAVFRASQSPLFFSKKQMIVRSKQNYATRLCQFVLQSVKERKLRHEALQKFMLYNDSVTVATEVPVYITRDDLEHLRSQLGFEIYEKKIDLINLIPNSPKQIPSSNDQIGKLGIGNSLGQLDQLEIRNSQELPKLITGHIDILQIRNGQIHILDYKPNAEKERPIEQLTLYAMALSRLTGLRLFEFKCAWFDEKDYFEFYPLHVLHKPKKGNKRRRVYTMEGVYTMNRETTRITQIRPHL